MKTRKLQEVLASWDGKATDPLEKVYEACRHEPDFLDTLIEFARSPDCENAATWLLKHTFDCRHANLSPNQSARHLSGLAALSHWEAKLHFLQYLEHLHLSESDQEPLLKFIEPELRSGNKFLRAWAHYALAIHAECFPAQRQYAVDTLTRARDRETAGSVKVRIRKALKKLGN